MLQTEFIRSLQSNYERVLLDQKPDEKKYQYCILSRGGIRGLLSCSLRYINGNAYLYYDITSKQNVAQLYRKQMLDREWVRNFFWSYSKINHELGRFLLDEKNILLYPEQIFQDLGNQNFSFLYLPYYEEGNGFAQLMEFIVDHLNYEDEGLVECIYKIYEQYDQNGEIYLQEKVFDDVRVLEQAKTTRQMFEAAEDFAEEMAADFDSQEAENNVENANIPREDRKGIKLFRKGKRRREKEQREKYLRETDTSMEECRIAEDEDSDVEECEKTIYIEETRDCEPAACKLYTPDGRVAANLNKDIFTIGKQKGEVDFVLEQSSASRIHARICKEDGVTYLEDLNSTNGTFKNGLRLQPYEKRRLEQGDEIRFGKELFIYR